MGDNSARTPMAMGLSALASTHASDDQQIQTKAVPSHVVKRQKEFMTVAFDLNSPYTMPTVKVPQTFGYVREPTQIGDKGFVTIGDFILNGVSGDGGGTANLPSQGNLTALAFQPISQMAFEDRDYDQLTLFGGPNGVKIIQAPQPGTGMGGNTSGAPAVPIPKTSINIDSLGQKVVHAIAGIAHIAEDKNLSISIPTTIQGIIHMAQTGIVHMAGTNMQFPTSVNGIVHMAEQGISHIADNALGGSLPPNTSGILHMAEQAITHTSLNGTITHAAMNGAMNFVIKNALTIGAPSPGSRSTDTTPPTPSQPTNVNILGSLSASVGISAPAMSVGGNAVMTEPVPPQLVNAPQIVTGAKEGNAALTSLIAALVTLGLITDQTTA